MVRGMKGKKWVSEVTAVLFIIAYEVFYFRKALNGHALFGISGDSFLINMLLEHWYDVFCCRDSILTLPAFWPAQGSLGYSDALLAPGLVYSLLRVFIAEPFSAFNPALILLHLMGVLVFYGLLRKMRMGIPLSLVGIFLSFWSCSFAQLSYHTQFFSMALVPVLFLGILCWWKGRTQGFRRRAWLALLITVVYGMLWLSSFYAAYFISLHMGMAAVAYGGIKAWGKWKEKLKCAVGWLKEHWKEVLLYGTMQLLWIVLFLWIYLPAYAEKKPYDYDFVIAHAPDVWDLLRTDSYAPLEWIISENMPAYLPEEMEYLAANRRMETAYGWSLAAFVLFMCAFVSAILGLRKKKGEKCTEERWMAAAGGTLLLLFLLSCRYGNFMPWAVLRKILPGADTIRVSGRCMGILTVPMAVIVCCWLRRMLDELKDEKNKARRMRWGIMEGLMAVALLWSGQAKMHMNDEVDRVRAQLQRVTEPPKDCHVMFVCPLDPEGYDTYMMNMEGWLIADRYGLQTINGYSGSYPAGWYMITDDIASYYGCLYDWVNINQIPDVSGIYGYIEETGTWVAYSDIQFGDENGQ